MLSIQNSSYGVSALVSSQLPSAMKNGDATPSPTRTTGIQADAAEGTRPAGGPPPGPPPGGPPPGGAPDGAPRTAGAADDRTTALTLLDTEETDETDDSDEATETTPEDLAAAHLMFDSIDLRETDEEDTSGSTANSFVSFDDAGTYRPAWIK